MANLLAAVRKVPLTAFETTLGFASGPRHGTVAARNLRPVTIPGTGVRLGIATSLPAFAYGPVSRAHACDDVAVTHMRCLDRLGANVLIQADANNGAWTGTDRSEPPTAVTRVPSRSSWPSRRGPWPTVPGRSCATSEPRSGPAAHVRTDTSRPR